jgi:hypothetical protein
MILSLTNKKELDGESLEEVENAMEVVRKDYSPGFFNTMRKFDYFQKGQHFRTQIDQFDGVDRCILGKEQRVEQIAYQGSVGTVGKPIQFNLKATSSRIRESANWIGIRKCSQSY